MHSAQAQAQEEFDAVDGLSDRQKTSELIAAKAEIKELNDTIEKLTEELRALNN